MLALDPCTSYACSCLHSALSLQALPLLSAVGLPQDSTPRHPNGSKPDAAAFDGPQSPSCWTYSNATNEPATGRGCPWPARHWWDSVPWWACWWGYGPPTVYSALPYKPWGSASYPPTDSSRASATTATSSSLPTIYQGCHSWACTPGKHQEEAG